MTTIIQKCTDPNLVESAMRIVRDVQQLSNQESLLKSIAPILFAEATDLFDVALGYDHSDYKFWEDSRVHTRTFVFEGIRDNKIYLTLHRVESIRGEVVIDEHDLKETFGDNFVGCDFFERDGKETRELESLRVKIAAAGMFREISDERFWDIEADINEYEESLKPSVQFPSLVSDEEYESDYAPDEELEVPWGCPNPYPEL